MTVNVSTAFSFCLYCKITSAADSEKEFHEIYDEVGVELQLPGLVDKFFHIKAENKAKQQLCDDCVNRLIELYDLEEHVREENEAGKDLLPLTSPGSSINKTTSFNDVLNKECSKENVLNLPNNKEEYDLKLENNFEEQEATNLQDASLKQKVDAIGNENWQSKEIENINFENNDTDCLSESPTQTEIDALEQNVQEKYSNKNEFLLVETLEEETNASTAQYSKGIVLKEDKHKTKDKITANLLIIEISSEECSVISVDETQSRMRNDTNKNEIIKEQEFVQEQIYDDNNEDLIEALIDYSTSNSNNDEQVELIEEEVDFEGSEEEFVEENEKVNVEENKEVDVEGSVPMDVNENEDLDVERKFAEVYYEEFLTVGNDKSTKSRTIVNNMENNHLELDAQSLHTNDSAYDLTSVYDIDTEQIIDDDAEHEEDAYSIDEEYLVEEIICSQDYDSVNLNEYLEKVITTKFENIPLTWEVECNLCQDKYHKFEDLLNHMCIKQFEEDQMFFCIIKDCKANFDNLQTLARHLILQHYDNLDGLTIYGKCTECQKTFSSMTVLNKHSCCRSIKKKTGLRTYCQSCDMDFQSLKRYVFHMQFHLTKHRPKVCLLCGILFNNSNDFFEHTQYKHNSESTMACINCDRFFKDKEVFESHMELHEDEKYQFSCTNCPKKYTTRFGLQLHTNVYHKNKSNALKCDLCKKEFVNNNSYRNHMKSHVVETKIDTFVCSTCGLISNNLDVIKEHTELDNDSPCYASNIEEKLLGVAYTCENCSIDFETIKQLKEHRLTDNHSDDLFHCGMCCQAFKTLRHMRNHSNNHKDYEKWQEAFPITRYFVCNIGDCQEFYPIWTTMYYHKKRPHKNLENSVNPTDFKCPFCNQLCTSKMSLAVHVARSHNNSNIKCSYCKRTYRTEKQLKAHIEKFHTSLKCEICFKDFKNKRYLDSHTKMIHLNIKRYFCQYCQKGYFHKSEKEVHENKSHPEFSYKCELCNFVTNYPKSLQIHMDKHSNNLKYKCTICSKSFGRKQLLQVHLKRHEQKQKYLCSEYSTETESCEASFLTHTLLKNHIQNKHQNSTNPMFTQQKEANKRKRSATKCFEISNTEESSFEIIQPEDDLELEQRSKETTIDVNELEYPQDTMEATIDHEMESVEYDNEYEICVSNTKF